MVDKDLSKLSGEEFLKLIIEGDIAPPNMAETISMNLIHGSGGKAVFHAWSKKEYLNPLGGVHGGFSATLLDSAAGCAVHTLLKPGEIYVTTDLNVKMLKAIPVELMLIAEAEVISISRQIALSTATLKDQDGVIYAYASATCLIKRN